MVGCAAAGDRPYLLFQIRTRATGIDFCIRNWEPFMAKKKMTMGLIVGNRGFFPDHLAKSGREEMLGVLQRAGIEVVALTPQESKYGAVETREESRHCAELFKRNRDRIDGVIVTLPNFGEERAIADTLR